MSSIYFSLNSTYLSSYRPQAAILAPVYWSNLLPVLFIAYCAMRHSKRMAPYTESVIFPTFTQAVATIPQATFLTWFAVFVGQNTPTTVLFCTMPKIIPSSFTIMSFSTITALAISRFIIIVCRRSTGVPFTALVSIIVASPLAFIVVLIHFDGFLYPTNDACMPILFLKLEHLAPYHIYTFAVPSIAVAFNLLTVAYRSRKNLTSVTKTSNEFYVAVSLFVQSVVPLITVGARAVISLNAVSPNRISIPVEVTKVLDVLGCFTVGLNALVAIIFLKTLRTILLELLPCAPRQQNVKLITTTSASAVAN